MYDVLALQTAFSGLIGLRQSNVPGVPILTGNLINSSSGIYVDDKHPLVSTDNLYYSCPNMEPSLYPKWVAGTSYPINYPVNYQGVIYISIQASGGVVPPPNDTGDWTPYNPFQKWLLQKYNQASSNMMSAIFTRKKLKKQAKNILEINQLYRGAGSQFNKIIPQGRCVGFSFTPEQAEGLWTIINKIGIQLTFTQNLPVYLYHTSQEDALGTWTYSAEAKTFRWQELQTGTPPVDNCIMKYLYSGVDTQGSYQFVFYEEDITPGNTIIEKEWNCSNPPCPGCDSVNVNLYNQWSRKVTVRNIHFPASALDLDDRTLPDQSQIVYDQLTNWGMNFSLTVRCDMTDWIIANLQLWADAFAVQLCKEYLEAIANGIRIGPSPAQTKLSAIAALDEKAPGNWITRTGGYNDIMDALNLDFSGFSSSCMPCEQSKKAKFFSM